MTRRKNGGYSAILESGDESVFPGDLTQYWYLAMVGVLGAATVGIEPFASLFNPPDDDQDYDDYDDDDDDDYESELDYQPEIELNTRKRKREPDEADGQGERDVERERWEDEMRRMEAEKMRRVEEWLTMVELARIPPQGQRNPSKAEQAPTSD